MTYHTLRPMTLLGKQYRHNEPVELGDLPLRKVAALVRVGYLVDIPDKAVAVLTDVEAPAVESEGVVCEVCGSTFKNDTGLKVHMSRKHEKEPEDG